MFPPDLSFHCGWWRQSWCKEMQLEAQCGTSRLVARDIRVSFWPCSSPTISALFRLPKQRAVASGSWLGPHAPGLPWPAITLASETSGLGPHHQPSSCSKRKGPLAKCPQFWASTTLITRFYSLFVCVCVCWRGGRVWSSITVLKELFKLCKSSYLAHREKSPKSTQLWFSSRVLG